MRFDPLSSLVASLDLTCAVFLKAELSHPWAITAHVTEQDCFPFMATLPRQVIAYHIVTEGRAIISLDEDQGYRTHCIAGPGDIIFLPTNALHVLASSPGCRPVSGNDLLLPAGPDGLVRIQYGGGGERTRILCGFIASNSSSSPILTSLPELMVIHIESLETRQWIQASVGMAARELRSGRLASDAIVSELCRLMLTEALRAHVERSAAPIGWLRGMAHPRMSHALARIHADLSAPLRVDDLAIEVGMSRSAFVARFAEVMGIGPGRYILMQRIEAAAALLRETQVSVSEISHKVGYDAPEAFSRAFKREKGLAPADWREKEVRAA
ncbi:MAG: AraC family transcriptional regulator [Pseudomonadota bacterium]